MTTDDQNSPSPEADEQPARTQRVIARPTGPSPEEQPLLKAAIRHHQAGELAEAEKAYRRVLNVNPANSSAWINLGVLMRATGRLEPAVVCLRRGLAFTPRDGSSWSNLGNALRALNRLDESKKAHERALSLDSSAAQIHYNMGLVVRDTGDLEEAQHCFRRAELLGYAKPDLKWDQALTTLLEGKLEEGFDAYRARWDLPESPPRHTDIRAWDGETLDGTLLVHAEQGQGDTIQFCRYLPLLRDRATKIIFECQETLVRLLQNSPAMDGIEILPRGQDRPAADAQVALLDLPHHITTTLDNLPGDTPYLAPPADAPHLMDPQGGNLRIGIVWAGKPSHKNDRNRSMPLTGMSPLFDLPGLEFVSLQMGGPEAQIEAEGLSAIIRDVSKHIEDFGDTASLLQDIDLVITVDTSVAHLAGALNRPVWVMLPFAPDWRWMMRTDQSPWYPSMKLFRQTSPGDWAEVIHRVRAAMKMELSGG